MTWTMFLMNCIIYYIMYFFKVEECTLPARLRIIAMTCTYCEISGFKNTSQNMTKKKGNEKVPKAKGCERIPGLVPDGRPGTTLVTLTFPVDAKEQVGVEGILINI